jgi:hypothetical protein
LVILVPHYQEPKGTEFFGSDSFRFSVISGGCLFVFAIACEKMIESSPSRRCWSWRCHYSLCLFFPLMLRMLWWWILYSCVLSFSLSNRSRYPQKRKRLLIYKRFESKHKKHIKVWLVPSKKVWPCLFLLKIELVIAVICEFEVPIESIVKRSSYNGIMWWGSRVFHREAKYKWKQTCMYTPFDWYIHSLI